MRASRSSLKSHPPDASEASSAREGREREREKHRSTCTNGKSATASAPDPPPTSRVGIFRRFVKVSRFSSLLSSFYRALICIVSRRGHRRSQAASSLSTVRRREKWKRDEHERSCPPRRESSTTGAQPGYKRQNTDGPGRRCARTAIFPGATSALSRRRGFCSRSAIWKSRASVAFVTMRFLRAVE